MLPLAEYEIQTYLKKYTNIFGILIIGFDNAYTRSRIFAILDNNPGDE